ncbi:OsmC family protein [Dactylosporangium sp. NBC_01737]|uniref:OsmC family protein n=1 Tax=Dactylosporangium sp. NBC_01737 TaxID=2975959 RepID=UPI002E1335F2|nr:OsmC family protein [Dactylosporangium sp. NBC_01737]
MAQRHPQPQHRPRLLRRRREAHLPVRRQQPAVFVGRDNGPTPTEYLLHALASYRTAGLANIAAARGIRLTEVRSTVTGDIDLNGVLGLNPDVRNGFQHIRVHFVVALQVVPALPAAVTCWDGAVGRTRRRTRRLLTWARYCEFPVTIGGRASGSTLPCLASRIGCLS